MKKVLVVSTSRKTRGGIAAVLKLYEQSSMWHRYRCRWIETHRDGSIIRKLWYFGTAFIVYLFVLPFYDIVHFHFALSTSANRKYIFFKIAKLFGKKTIIHVHCGTQIDDMWNDAIQTMFEQCDCGIVLSENLLPRIESHIGKSGKMKVVYNPCPIISDRKKYVQTDVILFSGTLFEAKGYKDLLFAFAKVAKQHPEWKVVFAGNGEIEQAKKLANELGIQEQVSFLGWVSGEVKHKAFSEAKVLCLPSYAEGFPMAVLDAWAYGLPVIATPVGGLPDVAQEGKNMLLFQPGDVTTLATKLDLIMNDDALRAKLARESCFLASQRFNLTTITEQVADIYSTL